MSTLYDQLENAISQGIGFIKQQQQSDGGFLSLSSPDATDFHQALQFHSTFSTTLILDCLYSLINISQLHSIKQKAATFLLTQKSEHWTFNYWTRDSEEAK